MSKYWIFDSQIKANTFYIIYNKFYNAYKLGITSKPIETRLAFYCKKECIDRSMVDILFCKSYNNAYQIEKNMLKLIVTDRFTWVAPWGTSYQYKEHFKSVTTYNNIVNELNKINQ